MGPRALDSWFKASRVATELSRRFHTRSSCLKIEQKFLRFLFHPQSDVGSVSKILFCSKML